MGGNFLSQFNQFAKAGPGQDPHPVAQMFWGLQIGAGSGGTRCCGRSCTSPVGPAGLSSTGGTATALRGRGKGPAQRNLLQPGHLLHRAAGC